MIFGDGFGWARVAPGLDALRKMKQKRAHSGIAIE